MFETGWKSTVTPRGMEETVTGSHQITVKSTACGMRNLSDYGGDLLAGVGCQELQVRTSQGDWLSRKK